ncbi:RNA methyltransferase [Candidatus Berkelbacteria bacterium]|nr:RNA methyltransferase [Candidatus Berkelbacteria bacterium]
MVTEARHQRLRRVVEQRQAGLTVLLEDMHDPHNAAAILRTADALGVQRVHCVFAREAPFNPRQVGKASSSSANRWLDFSIHRSIDAGINTLRSDGYQTIALALAAEAKDLYELDLTGPRLAFLVGNEKAGLSTRALEVADAVAMIPMRGLVQSLNVSVTAALALAEATRQRLAAGTLQPLSTAEQVRLLDDFLQR